MGTFFRTAATQNRPEVHFGTKYYYSPSSIEMEEDDMDMSLISHHFAE